MHDPQDARPRARSPFAAAFLSLLFPGLGHLYAGAPSRALGFAAAPILVIALLALGLVVLFAGIDHRRARRRPGGDRLHYEDHLRCL